MHLDNSFNPKGWLRHTHAQSLLASFKPRRWAILRRHEALKFSERIVLETSEGKLAADISVHPAPKGHAVLIHGWEGGSDSVYLISLASYLYKRGFSVSRLNLRDHGNTYHLNAEPFHGLRINEVAEAVKQLCERFGAVKGPNMLAGFSMGGNFALRVAGLAGALAIPLDKVFAISPAVRPFKTMQALASGPGFYRQYFRKKWRRSIRAKQAAWPGLYDFGPALKLSTLDEITDYFISQGLLPANNAETYLEGYRVTPEVINSISVPTEILTSSDDLVIPVRDIQELPKSPFLTTTILRHGGHCGFIENSKMHSYVDRFIFNKLKPLLGE